MTRALTNKAKKSDYPDGPAGVIRKRRDDLARLIESEIPMVERVKLIADLARGVKLADKGGGRVYTDPPNMQALVWLEEHVSGKVGMLEGRPALPGDSTDAPDWSGGYVVIPKQTGAKIGVQVVVDGRVQEEKKE
jgi:hypothetical protein